jgi:hypothetical protein
VSYREQDRQVDEISTLEVCRRQFENILYCCRQEPPILVDSIRAYAETALKRVMRDLALPRDSKP